MGINVIYVNGTNLGGYGGGSEYATFNSALTLTPEKLAAFRIGSDNFEPAYNYGFGMVDYTSNWVFQTITKTITEPITSLQLWLSRNNVGSIYNNGNVLCEIRNTVAGKAVGLPISSGLFDGMTIVATPFVPGWIIIPISLVILNAGTQYAISIRFQPLIPIVSSTGATGDDPIAGDATLNGKIGSVVMPGAPGENCDVAFDYGLTVGYGSSTVWTPDLGFGIAQGGSNRYLSNFSVVLTGLSPGTYHYRAKARDSIGIGYGADGTFVIAGPPAPPYQRDQAYALSRWRV